MFEVERFKHESIQDKHKQFFVTLLNDIEKGRIISAENDQALLTPTELIQFIILRYEHAEKRRFDMSEVERFEHESIQDKRSIQQFFVTLADGIEKGRIILSAENDQALLTPTELIRLSIKTKKKSGKSKLSIKLTWKDSAIESYRKKGNEIQISS